LSSCTQKMVCPAYQSAFIYDKEELRKKFSYFKEDSTPKIASVSKTKYLVAAPTTYRQKERSLKTVAAKPVRPIIPDSLVLGDSSAIAADLNRAARSVMDTTYIADLPGQGEETSVADDVYVISVDREVRVLKYNAPDTAMFDPATGLYRAARPAYYVKQVGFNVEQGNYLWYLRDVLILPDVRLAKMAENKKAEEEKKEKSGLKGFFSNLFKKKKKVTEEEELDQRISPDLEEYNFEEFDDNQPEPQVDTTQSSGKKKSVKSTTKKQKAPKQKAEPKPKKSTEPPSKEEEDDDGF
jgi:hypothetical protein